ncbi:hypothetical protein [Burkholderia sp. LMG 21824]|uniref:hypothetical protein n=1 Tax=Burkholderia sp. LMG 21824 TaxID=3158172 RepID=UPI003C30E58E
MSNAKPTTKNQSEDVLGEAQVALAHAAELSRKACGELLPRYREAKNDIVRIETEIARLHRASIPTSDMIGFLQDYIDARSDAFVPFLNTVVDRLYYVGHRPGTVLDKGAPTSFTQFECLLAHGGEALFPQRSGDPLYGISERIPLAGYTMGERMNVDAMFFYFGDVMKAALAAKADKIVAPSIPDEYRDESTRAERRAKLKDLFAELALAQGIAAELLVQLRSFGWDE